MELSSKYLSESNNSSSKFTFNRTQLSSDKTINNQNGGGFFCDDDFNNILLECFSDNRPDVACYLLCKIKKNPTDIDNQDEYGRNLFHYMSIYASHCNMVFHISNIIKKSSKSKLKKVLNCCDKFGNTPLHYATDLGYHNLVKLYIECGGDPKIKNKDGLYIDIDNSEENKDNNVSIIIASDSQVNSLDFLNKVIPQTINDSVGSFRKTVSDRRQVYSPTDIFRTEDFINEIDTNLKNMINTKQSNSINNQENNNDDNDTVQTEEIIKQILTRSRNSRNPENSATINSINSDNLLERIIKRVDESLSKSSTNIDSMYDIRQSGGDKKSKKKSKSKSKSKISRITGEKKISTYSEISNLTPLNSDDSDLSDVARHLSRQSSDIHERVVMKIIELLKLNKDNADDVLKARNYKAAVYRIIKEKNPLLNNFDRAVEMEKSITKEMLKSIDIDKVSKEIEKHLSVKLTTSKTNTATPTPTPTVSSSKSKSESKKEKKEKKVSKTKQKRIPEFSATSALSSLSNYSSDSNTNSYSSESEF